MKTLSADPCFDVACQLGEGPLWHPEEGRLFWVDIVNQDLFSSDRNLKAFGKSHFDTPVGAFGFRKTGGFVLATGAGFAFWDGPGANMDVAWNPLPGRPGVRLNDGKVDPAGRFWAGSMDDAQHKGELYRLDPDGSQHTLLGDIGISNGLGWSPDRKTMYYTDSFQYTIYAFDYDIETGQIGNQRVFVKLLKDIREIVPDGLCVDAEGCIWSARWNGWQVVRYSPKGEPLLKVEVPAQRVTSCCFGGPDLDQLFITTARVDLTDEERSRQPLAGNVFTCQTEFQGQPVNFFG
jgi:sugar lactone lactonase YvrE